MNEKLTLAQLRKVTEPSPRGKSEPHVEPIYARLGKLLAEIRRRRGMSQADVAERLNIGRPQLANIEAGRSRILLHYVVIACEMFGVDLFDVLKEVTSYGA